ncbi:MAG: hypothetical protein OIF50_15505 [Flavobacteriaceae bacterium]|nr:hypothetical protein [Flavobacteriaceae bacterium]
MKKVLKFGAMLLFFCSSQSFANDRCETQAFLFIETYEVMTGETDGFVLGHMFEIAYYTCNLEES